MTFAIANAIPAAMPAIGRGAAAAGSTAAGAGTAEHRKLVDAAQQFEGMLLQEMLKPMREHGFGQGESDDKDEGSGFGDTLTSFGTEQMATAISKGGGFGVAKKVVEQVEAERSSHEAAKRQ
jgi:Rod binding domain-containing protein